MYHSAYAVVLQCSKEDRDDGVALDVVCTSLAQKDTTHSSLAATPISEGIMLESHTLPHPVAEHTPTYALTGNFSPNGPQRQWLSRRCLHR